MLRGVHNAHEAVGASSPKVDTLGGTPNVDPLGETYNSVTPYRWGDYIAKYRLVPIALTRWRSPVDVEAADRPDAIRETCGSRWRGSTPSGSSRSSSAATCEKQPIEDPTSSGTRRSHRSQRVAVLRVPAQDSWDASQLREIDEETRFSIWTGLAAH